MKTCSRIVAVSLLAIAIPAIADGPVTLIADVQAGVRDPGVNQRQHRQTHRIQQGVRSGELTRGEARRLANEQRMIRQEEHAYKADGELSRMERKDLHQDLNEANRHIYREKHDAQNRSEQKHDGDKR